MTMAVGIFLTTTIFALMLFTGLCENIVCRRLLNNGAAQNDSCTANVTAGEQCLVHCDVRDTTLVEGKWNIAVSCQYSCFDPRVGPFLQPVRCEDVVTNEEKCLSCCTSDWCSNSTCHDSLLSFFNGLLTSTATLTPTASPVMDPNHNGQSSVAFVVLAICLAVIALVIALVAVIVCYVHFKKKRSFALPSPVKESPTSSDPQGVLTNDSGSGHGKPGMVQRTIARQIRLDELIGSGRYGKVYMGELRDEIVAVKIFSTLDEESWKREMDTYSIVLLRHDNILGYIGADMISNDGITELWLITQYHPLGSLFDFLSSEELKLNYAMMMKLIFTICTGLLHLHTEVFGINVKPAIAHRDLKSKNILVKSDYTCCIADFGLAVTMDPVTRVVNIPDNHKHGTVRYMAPEVLGNEIDVSQFESFVKVDIYALGLVMWEVCLRTGNGEVELHKVPFSDEVPHEPTIEMMKKIVYDNEQRPQIPSRWMRSDVLRDMKELMSECWYQSSSARLTAARVKKHLRMIIDENKELDF